MSIQNVFEKYTEKLWGRHPSQISADWGAQRVKGVSIAAVIKNALMSKNKNAEEKETSLIEQFWYPKYGPGQLWELLAEKIEDLGGKIQKNCKVIDIEAEENRIKSVTYIENEENKKWKQIFLYLQCH